MSRYNLVQTDGLIAPESSGGGATGDLALSTSGLAARADLNQQSLSASGSGGTTPLSYAWACVRPDGTASTSEFSDASTQNPNFTPARVGLYAVTCTVTDSAGTPLTATSTQSKTVGTVLSASISGFSNATDLSQQTVTATPAGGVTSYTYAWTCTRPDGTSSTSEFSSTTASNPNFTPASAGLHVLKCTVTDSASSTAIATSSADVGTGTPTTGTRQQVTDFTGWTKWSGQSTDNAWLGSNWNQFGTSTAGTGSADIAISGGVITLSDGAEPSASKNQPEECFGLYSPALSGVSVTTPGSINFQIEVTSASTTANSRSLVAFGLVSRPYDGANASNTNDQAFAALMLAPEISSGQDKSYILTGQADGSLTAGGGGAYGANAANVGSFTMDPEGDPCFGWSVLYDKSSPSTAETRIAASNTTADQRQFSTDDDPRLFIMLGRLNTGDAAANSFSVKLYWSYSKVGS